MLKNNNFKNNLNPHNVLLLHTDGIVEAMNAKGNLFSHEKLRDILAENGEGDVKLLKDKILAAMEDYTVDDDVTILVLKKTE